MIILKWFLIVLIASDFLADYIVKCLRNKKIAEHLGALLGFSLRAYIIYILITVWQV